MTRIRLDHFDVSRTFGRGCPVCFEAAWYACKAFYFLGPWPWFWSSFNFRYPAGFSIPLT